MSSSTRIQVVRTVPASRFRRRVSRLSAQAKGQKVVLIQNRRQEPKYLVDKKFLDQLVQENENVRETLAVLADTSLAEYLLRIGKSFDVDVRRGRVRLYSTSEVFGQS